MSPSRTVSTRPRFLVASDMPTEIYVRVCLECGCGILRLNHSWWWWRQWYAIMMKVTRTVLAHHHRPVGINPQPQQPWSWSVCLCLQEETEDGNYFRKLNYSRPYASFSEETRLEQHRSVGAEWNRVCWVSFLSLPLPSEWVRGRCMCRVENIFIHLPRQMENVRNQQMFSICKQTLCTDEVAWNETRLRKVGKGQTKHVYYQKFFGIDLGWGSDMTKGRVVLFTKRLFCLFSFYILRRRVICWYI